MTRLFRPDARGLDDRPPLLDHRLVERGECLRGLLLARHDLLAEVGEPLAHPRFGQRINGGGVEPLDDIPRRAFRSKQRIPDRTVEAGQSGLVRRRNLWGRAGWLLPITAKDLDAAAANLRDAVWSANIRSICPATRSCIAGAPPR